jgi:hypothetical protein
MPVSIVLTDAQVASVIAQAGTTPPPTPVPPVAWPTPASMGVTAIKRQDVSFGVDGSGQGQRYYVNGLGSKEGLIVVFRAPPADAKLVLTLVEQGTANGQPCLRKMVLSKVPGDVQINPRSPDGMWSDQANSATIRMSSGAVGTEAIRLEPGREYYLNVVTQFSDFNFTDLFLTCNNP